MLRRYPLKRSVIATVGFLFLSLNLFARRGTVTDAEARKLVLASLRTHVAKARGLHLELDREHGGCAVYHAYFLGGGAPSFVTFTVALNLPQHRRTVG
jgi:hypothetical protein